MKKTDKETTGKLDNKTMENLNEETVLDKIKGITTKINENLAFLAENGYSEEELEEIQTRLISRQRKKLSEEERKSKEVLQYFLKGNTYGILRYLATYYVEKEEAEMMGYKGTRVKITLPSIGNFKKYEFSYFVSDKYVAKEDFENNPELENKSYSMKDVGELLQNVNRFMIELQGDNDGNMDYENKLKYWRKNATGFGRNASDCLFGITGLSSEFWLKDKIVKNVKNVPENMRVYWDFEGDFCFFDRVSSNDSKFGAKLFLM